MILSIYGAQDSIPPTPRPVTRVPTRQECCWAETLSCSFGHRKQGLDGVRQWPGTWEQPLATCVLEPVPWEVESLCVMRGWSFSLCPEQRGRPSNGGNLFGGEEGSVHTGATHVHHQELPAEARPAWGRRKPSPLRLTGKQPPPRVTVPAQSTAL